MKVAPFLAVFLALLLLSVAPAPAQELAKPLEETKLVLRISREFLRKLAGVQFKGDQPINSNAGGATVTGNAHILGDADVKLHESKTESDFDLHINGEVLIQLTATQRPVQVLAHGTAPFNACRRIGFDGKQFSAQPIEVSASNHFQLDAICTLRGGLGSGLVQRVARPIVRRSLRDGDRQAADEIRTELAKSVDQATDKLTGTLNKLRPIVQEAEEHLIALGVLPKDSLKAYRAATKDHLLLSVGRANHRIPDLPELAKGAPVELWIARKPGLSGIRQQMFLDNWKSIEKVVHDQIVRRHPELAKRLDGDLHKYLDKVEVITVGTWHVVKFAPDLPKLPVFDLPPG